MTSNIQMQSHDYKLYLDTNNWRELEQFSLRLKEQNNLVESNSYYHRAESLFLKKHPQIDSEDLIFFEKIDWNEYINFFTDFKQNNYTKLRAIRHLFTYGIAGGRLGKFLVAKKQAGLAIAFFNRKILNYPQNNSFNLGYRKLLNELIKITKSTPATLDSLLLNNSIFVLQHKLIRENIALQQQISGLKSSFSSLDSDEYQKKYSLKLEQAERENAIDTFKIKSLNPKFAPQEGKISADQSTIFGKQGWLYISSGSNNLIEYHVGQKRLPGAKIHQWEQLLSARKNWHDTKKIKFQHIFIPNKIAVYPEYYPHKLDIQHKRPIQQLQQKNHQLFLYPLDLFSKYKSSFNLYEKQDCHWTFWGCFLAYKLLCQKFGVTPNHKLLDYPITISEITGDLGAKFSLSEKTLRQKINYSSQITYDNQVIYHCNQGSVRVLKNPRVSQGKMIIFGDSFSNPAKVRGNSQARLGARLASLFAETLSEVHFIWAPWVDYDYILQEQPDFVLTEMVERFLVRVPNDHEHLPLREFATQKLTQPRKKI